MAIDPIIIILSLFLYVIAIILISPVVFVIFIIKSIPIFFATLIEFWKTINLCNAVSWYMGVLGGTHVQQQSGNGNQNAANDRSRSGHDHWVACLNYATQDIVKFIEGYAHIKLCKIYCDIFKCYYKSIKCIKPNKLGKMLSLYINDMNPCKMFPEIGCSIIILCIPILMTLVMWMIGLLCVLTIPPASFLFIFVMWIVIWPFVIVIPPVIYILGWFLIIFGLPALYVVAWSLILTVPWIFSALGSITGPFLALKVPISMLFLNNHNPLDMWSNAKQSLVQAFRMLKSIDRWTATLSFWNIKIFCGNILDEKEMIKEGRGTINYWDLYVDRCIKESKNVENFKWITSDDIMACSPTATIAIPGVAIVAIMEDTIKQSKDEKLLLIYWNDLNKCMLFHRDFKDNIAEVFLPQVMKVKSDLMSLGPLFRKW